MPVDWSKYPADWDATSLRIRERDGQRCVKCGARNHEVIIRTHDRRQFIQLDTEGGTSGTLHDAETGALIREVSLLDEDEVGGYSVKIVLTVAHLDGNVSNMDDTNLAALCQMHHLKLDARQHAISSARTRRSRKATGDLFDKRAVP